MRYVLFIVVGLAGIALMAVGVARLGVPIAYGGMALAISSFVLGYLDHVRREDRGTP
jgi:hypothetical protein